MGIKSVDRILNLEDRRRSYKINYLIWIFALTISDCISHLFYFGSGKAGIEKMAKQIFSKE